MTFNSNAEHPALAESRKRLAMLERRTPPGYPLGYNLHVTEVVCKGCGSKSVQSELWTIMRAGASGKSYHFTHETEKIYDLPVDEVRRSRLTARCEGCVASLPREPVPAVPAYGQKLKPSTDRLAKFPGDWIGDLEPMPSAKTKANVEAILALFGVKKDG